MEHHHHHHQHVRCRQRWLDADVGTQMQSAAPRLMAAGRTQALQGLGGDGHGGVDGVGDDVEQRLMNSGGNGSGGWEVF